MHDVLRNESRALGLCDDSARPAGQAAGFGKAAPRPVARLPLSNRALHPHSLHAKVRPSDADTAKQG